MLMHTHERLAHAEVLQQDARVPRVFAGDGVHRGETKAGAFCDVAQVANGSGDDVKCAGLQFHVSRRMTANARGETGNFPGQVTSALTGARGIRIRAWKNYWRMKTGASFSADARRCSQGITYGSVQHRSHRWLRCLYLAGAVFYSALKRSVPRSRNKTSAAIAALTSHSSTCQPSHTGRETPRVRASVIRFSAPHTKVHTSGR